MLALGLSSKLNATTSPAIEAAPAYCPGLCPVMANSGSIRPPSGMEDVVRIGDIPDFLREVA